MTRAQLIEKIRKNQSFLCVGLDSDLLQIPAHLRELPDPVFAFNKAIIDATRDHCVAFKLNTAFYEAMGAKGWETLEKTLDYIPPTHFRIADAKRGDIGSTTGQYARAFFETLSFDAVTVNPYMGEDSVRPFLEYPGKWTIVLALTSNPGASDFELKKCGDGCLFEQVLQTASRWGSPENLMFVIGATHSDQLASVRTLLPAHFLLVPGIGIQGGDLDEITARLINADIGLLVNASRSVIYASHAKDFGEAARAAAGKYASQMRKFL
jgi:orotidine-5'-phosphate decarboxylase